MHLFLSRQSDRAYEPRPVDRALVERCVEAARLAPSACNAQPWKFIVVDNPELKNQIADATADRILPMNHFTKQAPVHVVIVRESPNLTSYLGSALKDRDFPLIDIGIAAEHFCLQAEAEGLGSCMLGWFKEKQVKKILHIPKNKRVELIITLGYPAGKKREKRRKSMNDILSYNTY
jgi:nitroreductase